MTAASGEAGARAPERCPLACGEAGSRGTVRRRGRLRRVRPVRRGRLADAVLADRLRGSVIRQAVDRVLAEKSVDAGIEVEGEQFARGFVVSGLHRRGWIASCVA